MSDTQTDRRGGWIIGLCLLSDRDIDPARRVRVCYRLTDKGRAYLAGKVDE